MAAKKKMTKKVAKKVATKVAKKPATKVAKRSIRTAQRPDVGARLSAVPSDQAGENPTQPVDVTVAELTRLFTLAKPQRARLVQLPGFEARWLDEAPAYIDVLAESETVWSDARSASRAGISPRRVVEAEALKDDAFASARYVLRKDPVVQQGLDEIAQGTGVADLAADLASLATLVASRPQEFAADTVLPVDFVQRARALSVELATGIDPTTAAEAQERRNRAFWVAEEASRELREALKFIWRKQPAKIAQLGASYASRLRRDRANRAKEGGGGPAPRPA